MTHWIERKLPFLIFIFALALRVAYLIFLQENYFFFGHPGDDVLYYKHWAQAIAMGEGTGGRAFSGMPLFPYYLSVLWRLCFEQWALVHFANLILGSVNCVLVYVLARRFFPNPCAGLAGLLAAANFVLIYYDWLMMPITLLITLTLLILLALSGQGPRTQKEWLILGALIGLAGLGDGKFIIFAALLAGYLFWTQRREGARALFKTILPLGLGLVIVLGGVTLRNKLVSGDWVFITSQSGLSLFVGNNPEATGVYDNPEFIRPTHEGQDLDQQLFVEQTLGKKVSASAVSDFYRQRALNFIFNHPADYLKLLTQKFILFFSDNEAAHDIDLILQRQFKFHFDINPYLTLMPLALIGIFLSLKEKRGTEGLALIVFSQLLFCLIYFVTTRHRASILPVLLIFQAYCVFWLAKSIRAKKYPALITSVTFITVCVALFPPKFLSSDALAFIHFTKSGPIHDKHKNYLKAQAAYLAALSIRPHDVNTLYNLGTSYLKSRDHENAIKTLQRSLELCHFNVDSSFNLGVAYEETGQIQNALESFHTVLKYEPDSLDARFRIAKLHQDQGQCDDAQKYYAEIIRAKPRLGPEIQKLFSACVDRK